MAAAEAAASASKRMAAAEAASASKRMAAEEKECCYLPDELLEYIFKSVNDDNLTFKSLSALSKQFLSITNRLRFSVTITDETIPFLPRLFLRFPNLTSLNLTLLSKTLEQVDEILTLISTFPLRIKSLNLSNDINTISIPIPANGLIALSKTMTNLTSLTFYGMKYFDKKDLFFIAHYFPLLEEVNLINPRLMSAGHFMIMDEIDTLLLTLPNLRKIDLSGNIYVNGRFIQVLRKNCKLLQEIIIPPRPWTSRNFICKDCDWTMDNSNYYGKVVLVTGNGEDGRAERASLSMMLDFVQPVTEKESVHELDAVEIAINF